MKKILLMFIISLFCLVITNSNAYKISTTNVTSCITNSDFTTLNGWYSFYDPSLSGVSIVTCLNEVGVLLKTNYCNTTVCAQAGIQNYSPAGTYYPINLLNSDKTEIVHDALVLKIQYMASTPACWSESSSYISGDLYVLMQSCLSCSTDDNNINPPYMTDTEIFQLGGFNVSTSQPIYCKATSWTDMYLTFIPPEESDWWQIRNLCIGYIGMPNQPCKSGIIINKIELYAIRVDAE
jgi:hypothetical protein